MSINGYRGIDGRAVTMETYSHICLLLTGLGWIETGIICEMRVSVFIVEYLITRNWKGSRTQNDHPVNTGVFEGSVWTPPSDSSSWRQWWCMCDFVSISVHTKLTHWGWDDMAHSLQTTFSKAFQFCMKGKTVYFDFTFTDVCPWGLNCQ